MRRHFTFICFLLIIVPCYLTGKDLSVCSKVEQMYVKGEIADSHRVRSTLPEIIAIAYPEFIDITFNVNCDAVNIEITDESGEIVYQTCITDTKVNKTLKINTSGWTAGGYTIHFTNLANGKKAYARFLK